MKESLETGINKIRDLKSKATANMKPHFEAAEQGLDIFRSIIVISEALTNFFNYMEDRSERKKVEKKSGCKKA